MPARSGHRAVGSAGTLWRWRRLVGPNQDRRVVVGGIGQTLDRLCGTHLNRL